MARPGSPATKQRPGRDRVQPPRPLGGASRAPFTVLAVQLRRRCIRSSSTTSRRSWLGRPSPTPWARECRSGSNATSGATWTAVFWPIASPGLGIGLRQRATDPVLVQGRGICPSCNARRMCEVAARLTDHVPPHVPARQWVLSVPKRRRLPPPRLARRRRGAPDLAARDSHDAPAHEPRGAA
jgi:hypothetical protein